MKNTIYNCFIVAVLILWYLFAPARLEGDTRPAAPPTMTASQLHEFLVSKKSPLAGDVDVLLKQKQWRLIVAISAIESSYCVHSLGNNCWGIKDGSGGYATYPSLGAAIPQVEALIERRQAQGKWLTPEAMNCSYVVPCNPNWVRVVNLVLKQLN